MPGMTPETLGFIETGQGTWRKAVRGREIDFRLLTELADFAPLEELQREVMGASDLDLFPASGMIVVPETGGHVLGAYMEGELCGADTASAATSTTWRGSSLTGWASRRGFVRSGSGRNSSVCRQR